jgi:general secretion pathway protein J
MTGRRSEGRNGFTLVEMLIALTIFGMLTAAGVALLTLTVRTQETSARILDELGEIRRLGALLTADLGQAVPRIRRDGDGRPRPALLGGSGETGPLLALVRSASDEEEGVGNALRRVEYRLAGGRLERLAFAQVDGEAVAVAMPLLEDVRSVRLRYRDRDGEWRTSWDPTDPAQLPRAVEIITHTDRQGMVRQVFAVGSGR